MASAKAVRGVSSPTWARISESARAPERDRGLFRGVGRPRIGPCRCPTRAIGAHRAGSGSSRGSRTPCRSVRDERWKLIDRCDRLAGGDQQTRVPDGGHTPQYDTGSPPPSARSGADTCTRSSPNTGAGDAAAPICQGRVEPPVDGSALCFTTGAEGSHMVARIATYSFTGTRRSLASGPRQGSCRS